MFNHRKPWLVLTFLMTALFLVIVSLSRTPHGFQQLMACEMKLVAATHFS